MPTTPNLSLPYPLLTDDNNPPADFQALALAMDGAVGVWASYTPTVSGVPGTATGRYTRVGKLVIARFLLTASATASGTISVGRPVAAVDEGGGVAIGTAMAIDTSVGPGSRRGLTVVNNGTTQVFFIADSLTSAATVGATVPWTWASGDTIAGTFTYEAA